MTTVFIGVCMRTGTTLLNGSLRVDPTVSPVTGAVLCPSHPMRHHLWVRRDFRLDLEGIFRDRSVRDTRQHSGDGAGAR